MGDSLTDADAIVRLPLFAATFLLIAAAESLWTRRRDQNRTGRWPTNLGLALINLGLVRLGVPMTLVAVAATCQQAGVGALNLVTLPAVAALITSLILLDLALYWQHRAMHALPWLWRLHRVHHADLACDVTTGLRFHPCEALVSVGFKAAIIVITGVPADAVFVFEMVLSTASLFTHGNLALPVTADRWLRYILVTPDMHRIHHSVVAAETDHNFGFSLSCWDRIFGTWQQDPALGQIGMRVGVEGPGGPAATGLVSLLVQPFRARDAIESGETPPDL